MRCPSILDLAGERFDPISVHPSSEAQCIERARMVSRRGWTHTMHRIDGIIKHRLSRRRY